MIAMVSFKPVFAILASLVAILPIYIFRKKPNLREFFTFLAAKIKSSKVSGTLPPRYLFT